MNSAICTLFEGDYHYGVAALTNSLQRSGFRGSMFAGHRGDLPKWALAGKAINLEPWPGARSLQIEDGLDITFLPLSTVHHLTNYKPQFMLDLLDGPGSGCDALFYLDPDICVTAPWRYFEQWIDCGVALCEDVNSPLPEHHPRRIGWRRYYAGFGVQLGFKTTAYVNGGFVGVRAVDRPFLETWHLTMNLMAKEIGSLAVAKIAAGAAYASTGFANCFDCSDQDALNATVEASSVPVSIIGQEAMAFKSGAALLPHALGPGKPWQRNYLGAALQGVQPRVADRAYWTYATAPLALYSPLQLALKRLDMHVAAALGRFMRKG